jgi:uncharacterized protein
MSEANVKLVQAMYAAFGKGDIASIVGALTADADWESVGRPADYPGFGKRKGQKAVQEFFGFVAQNVEFSEFSPREFYATGNKIFVLGHYAGKLKKTGRPFSSDFIHVFTAKGGKVEDFKEFLDTAQLAEAYRG